MPRQISAERLRRRRGRVCQHAVLVAPARLRAFGLGMAQQQQATHEFSGLFLTPNCR